MSHQGAWEGHVQGEAVQADGIAGGRVRDVRILNWRKLCAGNVTRRSMQNIHRSISETGTGEPDDTETVQSGSGSCDTRSLL